MTKSLYVLLKNNKPGPILWKEQDGIAFEALKEHLMNSSALGQSNYQSPFFPFVYEKEGNALEVLTQKHGDHHQPIGYYSQQLDPVAWG